MIRVVPGRAGHTTSSSSDEYAMAKVPAWRTTAINTAPAMSGREEVEEGTSAEQVRRRTVQPPPDCPRPAAPPPGPLDG